MWATSSLWYWSAGHMRSPSILKNCPDKTENLAGFDVLMTNVEGEGWPSLGLSPPSWRRQSGVNRKIAGTSNGRNSQTKNTNWFLLGTPPVMNLAEKIGETSDGEQPGQSECQHSILTPDIHWYPLVWVHSLNQFKHFVFYCSKRGQTKLMLKLNTWDKF